MYGIHPYRNTEFSLGKKKNEENWRHLNKIGGLHQYPGCDSSFCKALLPLQKQAKHTWGYLPPHTKKSLKRKKNEISLYCFLQLTAHEFTFISVIKKWRSTYIYI